MGRLAFVFAGQGAQFEGMGKDLHDGYPAVRGIFSRAENIHPGLSDCCFNASAASLSSTINTQPCMYVLEMGITALLGQYGIVPEAAAGFSLGETAALAAAGTFRFEDGLRYILLRAQAMEAAAKAHPGMMAAILKLSAQEVETICEETGGVWAVNYNTPEQTVISGQPDSVRQAIAKAAALGGKGIPLAVSGAFHSPYMQPAYETLRAYLEAHPPRLPVYPVYGNVTGGLIGSEDLPEQIAQQVKSPVLWEKTIRAMKRDGFDRYVEIGPGTVLSRLIRRIDPESTVSNVQDIPSLQQTLADFGIAPVEAGEQAERADSTDCRRKNGC